MQQQTTLHENCGDKFDQFLNQKEATGCSQENQRTKIKVVICSRDRLIETSSRPVSKLNFGNYNFQSVRKFFSYEIYTLITIFQTAS